MPPPISASNSSSRSVSLCGVGVPLLFAGGQEGWDITPQHLHFSETSTWVGMWRARNNGLRNLHRWVGMWLRNLHLGGNGARSSGPTPTEPTWSDPTRIPSRRPIAFLSTKPRIFSDMRLLHCVCIAPHLAVASANHETSRSRTVSCVGHCQRPHLYFATQSQPSPLG